MTNTELIELLKFLPENSQLCVDFDPSPFDAPDLTHWDIVCVEPINEAWYRGVLLISNRKEWII